MGNLNPRNLLSAFYLPFPNRLTLHIIFIQNASCSSVNSSMSNTKEILQAFQLDYWNHDHRKLYYGTLQPHNPVVSVTSTISQQKVVSLILRRHIFFQLYLNRHLTAHTNRYCGTENTHLKHKHSLHDVRIYVSLSPLKTYSRMSVFCTVHLCVWFIICK